MTSVKEILIGDEVVSLVSSSCMPIPALEDEVETDTKLQLVVLVGVAGGT